MGWLDRFKPHSGGVYRPGECLPGPQHQTATGRKLYTVQQIRAAYVQCAKNSRTLLTRCRNMLSHPANWGADDDVMKARRALYTEVLEHLNGLEHSEAWTEAEKRRPGCKKTTGCTCEREKLGDQCIWRL